MNPLQRVCCPACYLEGKDAPWVSRAELAEHWAAVHLATLGAMSPTVTDVAADVKRASEVRP